ncbi:hypothetical protein KR084_001884 [Drosophila pseudotakahashii]|nr:hypothetical protein KR084_001884 [Drosophila pseudotakahashii]
MRFAAQIFIILIGFLVAGSWSQDVIPEFPVDDRPTTTTEPTTTSTTEIPTTSTTEITTTSTTEPSTTSTTEASTTSTTEITTTSTTESTTSSTTEREPIYPTYQPSHVVPTYTTKKSRVMQPLERCFLRNQLEYSNCWPYSQTTNCYRCCYYYDSHLTECRKLRQGPCSPYDYGKLKVHVNWKEV